MSSICDDLRASILQAAMQGKLTEQLPEDGNAEDLLEKIKVVKEKLAKEGKIKKREVLSDVLKKEELFEIPENWKWVRVGNLGILESGFSFKSSDYKEYGVQVVRISDLGEDEISTKNAVYYQDDPLLAKYEIKKDSILICLTGSIGKMALIADNQKRYLNQRVGMYSLYEKSILDYMWRVLHAENIKFDWISHKTSTNGNIKNDVVLNTLIPLPPLAEQKRIVKKIDELMARVADLEKSADALASLKKAFPDDIKASLLQYAMQGKLTKQLPEDGSAEELIEEIKAEKEKLVAEGKIKKQKQLAPITDDEIPFNIPENWRWERFGNLGSYRKGPFGSALTKSIFVKDSEGAVKVYEQKNAIKKDATLGDYFISRKYYEEKMKNFQILPGDIIVSCAGTIGETYIMPDKIREGIINQALMRMRMFDGVYIPYFLIYFDYIIKASAISNSKGSAIKNIPPFEVLNMYPVAIPPFAEQKRIVECLENLMQNINAVGELIASE